MERCHLRIKDLPTKERPYEKLEKYGANMLSEAELLAIIIKTGTKEETSVSIAQKILKKYEKFANGLMDITLEGLTEIKGIGKVKAIQIMAALEFGKRIISFKASKVIQIKSPQDVCELLMEDMRLLKKEYVKAILLNTKNQLIKVVDISVGSLNTSIIHPREVFKDAITHSSASMILVHNHPSGDPNPSTEDIAVTKRVYEVGKIVGIELLDHIIIGNKSFISLKEKNIF